MQSAYSVGRWQQIIAQADQAPYLMYDAVDDFRTRPLHRAWDNTILRYDHIFWKTHYPPNGWGCRCGVIQHSDNDLTVMGLKVSDVPKISYANWQNPRTGKNQKVPEGIDAGFDFNPGQVHYDHLKQLSKEKAQNMPEELIDSAKKSIKNIEAEIKKPVLFDETQDLKQMPSVRTDWGDFPDSIIVNQTGTIADHAQYIPAKAGDIDAAIEVANDYLTVESLKSIQDVIGKDGQQAIVVAVHAEESEGRNKLPVAFALLLEHNLGAKIDDDIVQAERAFRTGADGYDRLVKKVSFDGRVTAGASYFIVDDAITQGGTLADLRGYIETNGGKVIGSSVLMGKPHSAKLAITKATLGQLRKVAGKDLEVWWNEQFGYDFSRLTESEARYIAKQIHRSGINFVRDRIFTSRQTELNRTRSNHSE